MYYVYLIDESGNILTDEDGNRLYVDILSKFPTTWNYNPSNIINEYTYDLSTLVYDSLTSNYDGVVATDLAEMERLPAMWSDVDT